MNIEYEATFLNIDKDDIRRRLKKVKAKLTKPEFLQKRLAYSLPKGHEVEGGWLRIRDEGEKITMSYKMVDGDKIENQKEICLEINDFNLADKFLRGIGCKKKAYQETKRELWLLDNVEITIDEWPFLEPLVEVEGVNETDVKKVSERLGFNYDTAYFGSIDTIYSKKYKISKEQINCYTPEITFKSNNPFIK